MLVLATLHEVSAHEAADEKPPASSLRVVPGGSGQAGRLEEVAAEKLDGQTGTR